MKKIAALLIFVLALSMTNIGLGMSLQELEQMRQKMADMLARTPEVTWDDLLNNEEDYRGKIVKFTGVVKGRNDPLAGFHDKDGHVFVVKRTSYYQLLMEQEYTISGRFNKIVTAEDGDKAAMFEFEEAHLPFFSEYGL